MGTILEILTTNYDGQYADITFYPCSGGSINIGGVILPYNYQTEYYYGTYDIYLPNYDKTCSLNVPCLTPTVTPTPTQTPTPSITPTNTVTPTITPTNTVTPTITPTITPTVTPTPSPLPPTIEYFKECCFGNITYKVGGVTTPITVGNTYYITTDEFTFCGIASNEEPYDNQSLVVTVSSYTNCVLCITDNPCPSPTPTNTPTETPIPTPTETPTPTPPSPPLVFVSTWKTDNLSAGSSTSTQVKLPLESTGTYNFTVDWGDGSALENITTAAAGIHTYGTAGTYTISITGTIIGFSFGSTVNPTNTNERLKILSISSWGPIRLGNSGGYFNGCVNLTCNTITDILNLTGTITLASMFFSCTSITTVGRMNEWNLSGVTNLSSMFGMFVGGGTTGIGLFNQNIGAWDVSNVTSFGEMFRFTALFNNGGSSDIQNWNVSSAINMNGMFSRANRFNQPLANWERSTPGNTSTLANVTDMGNMFSSSNNSLGFNQPIGNWNVSSVQNMSALFYRSPFNQDIGNWNVSNVTTFGIIFATAGSVSPFSPTTLDLIYNGWSTRPVQPNRSISFSSTRTAASNTGKSTLQSAPNNWIINDGGVI